MSSTQLAEFVQNISHWANFYILFGTVAVTLVGLLFVAAVRSPLHQP